MRRKILLVMAFLWLVAFIRLIITPEENENKANIVTAFSNEKFLYTDSILKAEAGIGNKYYTDDERKEYLCSFAKALGLTEEYEISIVREDNAIIATLTKPAKRALTTIKLVTYETEKDKNIISLKNYIYVELKISNSLESAVTYQEKLKGIFEDMDIVADISLNLVGSIDGELNNTEKNSITDKIMQEMNAEVITGNRSESIYTIYGYSEDIADYVVFGSTKTNVNIAISYDEEEDMTKIYMSTPIINEDF